MPGSSYVLEIAGTTYSKEEVGFLGSGNLYGDPLFIFPAFGVTGDYHLKRGSPAIDAGIKVDGLDIDLEGNRRPAGCGYDVGAYEMHWY